MISCVVLSSRPHPGADHLHLAEVDYALGPRQIVYGGTRVLKPGDRVIVAPPGSRLPDGTKIRTRQYRGEKSWGMLCSSAEAGLGHDTSQVFVVPMA